MSGGPPDGPEGGDGPGDDDLARPSHSHFDRVSGGFATGFGAEETFGAGATTPDWGLASIRESKVGTLVDPPRQLAEGDLEPPSLLRRARMDPVAVVWGLVAAGGVHLAFPMLVAVVGLLLLGGPPGSAQPDEDDEADDKELAVVETKFVKLGRPFDPRELPNRRIPQQSTAAVERQRAPAKRAETTPQELPPDVDAGPPPPDPVEDLLTRLGTRADELARRSNQDYAEEGDPEGVAGGTETRETGSIYPGRLRNFFRRGFSVPTHLSADDLEGLRAVVRIEIGADGRLAGWRLTNPSGNPDFDDAVTRRMRQAEGSELPEVPEDERDRFLGHATNVAFTPPR
jgi:TonB family protein